jgi:hypothetical protein
VCVYIYTGRKGEGNKDAVLSVVVVELEYFVSQVNGGLISRA